MNVRLSLSSTLLFALGMLVSVGQAVETADAPVKGAALSLPQLAPAVTSFGAAISGDYLYVYGGQLGKPHSYNDKSASQQLQRIKLANGSKWEELAAGPKRIGLALVGFGGKLYRVGGFEPRNPGDKDWELYSSSDFASFDPQTGKWTDLAPLPAGRSSHDAVVIGSKLYVVGGWNMQGKDNTTWHTDGIVCDLAAAELKWETLATAPPFQRRALALAEWKNKLYVIGGMTEDGEMVTTVDVFDPQSNTWSTGPALPGEESEGFGVSAFSSAKGLVVTPHSGAVLRLNDQGDGWKEVSKLQTSRFFHRQVALPSGEMLVVAGSSPEGKTGSVEIVTLP